MILIISFKHSLSAIGLYFMSISDMQIALILKLIVMYNGISFDR